MTTYDEDISYDSPELQYDQPTPHVPVERVVHRTAVVVFINAVGKNQHEAELHAELAVQQVITSAAGAEGGGDPQLLPPVEVDGSVLPQTEVVAVAGIASAGIRGWIATRITKRGWTDSQSDIPAEPGAEEAASS